MLFRCGLKIDAQSACFSRLMNNAERRWPHFRPSRCRLRQTNRGWCTRPLCSISASPSQNRCIRCPRCASGCQNQLFNIFNTSFFSIRSVFLNPDRSYKLNLKCITLRPELCYLPLPTKLPPPPEQQTRIHGSCIPRRRSPLLE